MSSALPITPRPALRRQDTSLRGIPAYGVLSSIRHYNRRWHTAPPNKHLVHPVKTPHFITSRLRSSIQHSGLRPPLPSAKKKHDLQTLCYVKYKQPQTTHQIPLPRHIFHAKTYTALKVHDVLSVLQLFFTK